MMNTQCSKHVEAYNKLIIKQEFVHKVGQLPRVMFYADCSTEWRTVVLLFSFPSQIQINVSRLTLLSHASDYLNKSIFATVMFLEGEDAFC